MNIFAEELVVVLSSHGKTLSSLYGLRIRDPRDQTAFYRIHPHKVTRLIKSRTKDMTAMLNADELGALQEWTPLDPAGLEMRRLRAAIVAEGVRHLLAGRMATDQASELGLRTLNMLLESADADEVVDRIRGLEDAQFYDVHGSSVRDAMSLVEDSPPDTIDDTPKEIGQALETAYETFEEGILWLEIARATPDSGARLGLAAMSKALLLHARELFSYAPGVTHNMPQHAEWLIAVEEALREASYLQE